MSEAKNTPAISADVVRNSDGTPIGLELACANGQRLRIGGGDLSAKISEECRFHGLKQKLVDAAAISRNPDTGRSATPDDKWAALMEVYDRITGEDGEWNKRREGGSGTGGLLYRALCRLYKDQRTPEQVETFLEGKTKAEQAALRANPKVAAIIEELKAESTKAGDIDSDELLAGL